MKGYDLKEYLRPIWNTNLITNETFMFLDEDDEANLLYYPDKIISVKNYFLDKDFLNNKDYIIENGKIKRVKTGNIPYYKIEDYYVTDPGIFSITINDEIRKKYSFNDQRYLLYGECDTFTKNQISISYTTKSKWTKNIPLGKENKLPTFTRKLKNQEKIYITFYGDSIMTGCNSSGTLMGGNVPPFMPSFPEMIKEFLIENFDADIELSNVSQGGWDTYSAFNAFKERVLPTKPDLLILGFGMNDLDTPIDEYEKMYREMINSLKEQNPNIEIVLVSTMLPNPESTWLRNQLLTKDVHIKLEKEDEHIARAGMYTIHKDLLTIKRYRDMTANNINHPNDFLCRIYAQVILKTILGSKFERIYEK